MSQVVQEYIRFENWDGNSESFTSDHKFINITLLSRPVMWHTKVLYFLSNVFHHFIKYSFNLSWLIVLYVGDLNSHIRQNIQKMFKSDISFLTFLSFFELKFLYFFILWKIRFTSQLHGENGLRKYLGNKLQPINCIYISIINIKGSIYKTTAGQVMWNKEIKKWATVYKFMKHLEFVFWFVFSLLIFLCL